MLHFQHQPIIFSDKSRMHQLLPEAIFALAGKNHSIYGYRQLKHPVVLYVHPEYSIYILHSVVISKNWEGYFLLHQQHLVVTKCIVLPRIWVWEILQGF